LLSPQLKRANLGAEFDGIDDIARKIASDEAEVDSGIDGIVRKIASDEADVDSAEQDSFISAQIILSEQLATKLCDGDADEALDDSRDAGYDTAAGESCSILAPEHSIT
jgi:hypothetical protein